MKGPKGQKPRRETRRAAENVDLKREVHHLKRKVARLQKELERMAFFVVDDDGRESSAEPKPPSPACGDCRSQELAEFKTPGDKVILVCKRCRWRSV